MNSGCAVDYVDLSSWGVVMIRSRSQKIYATVRGIVDGVYWRSTEIVSFIDSTTLLTSSGIRIFLIGETVAEKWNFAYASLSVTAAFKYGFPIFKWREILIMYWQPISSESNEPKRKSPCPGVVYAPQTRMWIATSYDKPTSRSFPLSKYGNDEALRLAIQARRESESRKSANSDIIISPRVLLDPPMSCDAVNGPHGFLDGNLNTRYVSPIDDNVAMVKEQFSQTSIPTSNNSKHSTVAELDRFELRWQLLGRILRSPRSTTKLKTQTKRARRGCYPHPLRRVLDQPRNIPDGYTFSYIAWDAANRSWSFSIYSSDTRVSLTFPTTLIPVLHALRIAIATREELLLLRCSTEPKIIQGHMIRQSGIRAVCWNRFNNCWLSRGKLFSEKRHGPEEALKLAYLERVRDAVESIIWREPFLYPLPNLFC